MGCRTVDDRLVTSTTIDRNRSSIDSRFIGQAILSLRDRQAAVVESQLGSARFSADGAIGTVQINRIAQVDIFIEIDFVFHRSISRCRRFNGRVHPTDNFHSFFGKVIDDLLATFCDVGEIRFGDARNLCFTRYRVAIAVDVGHGDGTIITYRIGIGFDMDIFAFGDVLNLCYCIIRDIGEVRICQAGSFKLNLTICSSDGNMVTSNKVDFLIDSINICTASLSRPEIAGACQSRRGNLDVSLFIADRDVITIDEVQRSIFLYSLGSLTIDISSPADILQSIVNRIACDDVGVTLFNRTICLDVYAVNDVPICLVIRRFNSSIGSICQFNARFLELCHVDSIRICCASSQTCQLAGILEVKKISIFIRFPSSECFVADGYGPQICMPHGGIFFSIGEHHSCTVSYIIIDAFCICFPRRAGSIAQCNTIGSGCFSSHTYSSRVPASCLGACTKSSGPGPGFGIRAQGSGIAPGTIGVFLTSVNSLCPICISLCTDGNRVGPFSTFIIIRITDSNGIHTFRFGIVAYGQRPFTISMGTIAKSCCPQTTISIGTSPHCDGIQSYGAVIVIVACSGNIVRIDAEVMSLSGVNLSIIIILNFCLSIINSSLVLIGNSLCRLGNLRVYRCNTSNIR